VVGYNYSFAKYGAGTPETLQALGSAHGFPVEVVPPVAFLEEPVSSTRIRTLIEQGAVRMAAAMLLRPYTLCGTVIRNRQFGREMGFPTANIWPEPGRVLPKDGVYVSEAQVGGERYRAITNVGKNPTVGGERLAVETHLLDFSGDLYGRRLCVSFLEYMRGEQRFDSPADLQKRIAADVETARGYKRT
jgi:riboflavin kinase/FMN adenylyltransferase